MSGSARYVRRLANALSFNGHFPWPRSLARRLYRHAKGIERIENFDSDLSMDLSLSEHMQRRIFWMGYYSEDVIRVIKQRLRPGMTFVDIGANIGEVSLVAAKIVGPQGHVLAFEPVDTLADRLQEHTNRNGLQHVRVVRMGLSDHDGTAVIYDSCGQGEANDEHQGLSSLFGDPSRNAALQTIELGCLDTFLSEPELERVDLIKIDIEGGELTCLRGAESLLRKHRPALIVEIQSESARRAGYRPEDILNFLSVLGYEFHTIAAQGELRPLTAATLKPFQNVLCLAPQH
ncbi:FkbM family methyltransferase [Pseudoxanthomonas mexicana]